MGIPSWVIGGNSYTSEADLMDFLDPVLNDVVEYVSDQIQPWIVNVQEYVAGTDYTVALPADPSSGHTYVLLVKNFTSPTTFSFDVIAFAFAGDPLVIDAAYIVNNSEAVISSVAYEGSTVTFTFSTTRYMVGYLLRCA